MRLAVVGGGIFGCTVAILAARAGHEVHLYEEKPGLLRCASGINQYRLHYGYHYPRSPDTARECRQGVESFRKMYGPAVIDDEVHYYAIAREGSQTDFPAFLGFCVVNGLWSRSNYLPEIFDYENVDGTIEAVEARFDHRVLRGLVEKKLRAARVTLHLGMTAPKDLRDEFDKIIIATYANINGVAEMLGCKPEIFQFEVCEKPVISLPEEFGRTSIVVMDGEYCSIDPFGSMNLYVMGHVRHAIHSRNFDHYPEVPGHLKAYINKGVIRSPRGTRFKSFIESGAAFVPMLKKARHMGSMFTVRAVLPFVDDTDRRPTLVEELDDQVIRVFSGKIPSCVDAARTIVSLLEPSRDRMDDRVQAAE